METIAEPIRTEPSTAVKMIMQAKPPLSADLMPRTPMSQCLVGPDGVMPPWGSAVFWASC